MLALLLERGSPTPWTGVVAAFRIMARGDSRRRRVERPMQTLGGVLLRRPVLLLLSVHTRRAVYIFIYLYIPIICMPVQRVRTTHVMTESNVPRSLAKTGEKKDRVIGQWPTPSPAPPLQSVS